MLSVLDIERNESNISNNVDWWHSHLSFFRMRKEIPLICSLHLLLNSQSSVRIFERTIAHAASVLVYIQYCTHQLWFQSYPQRLTVVWQTDAVDMHTVKEWMQWTYWNIHSRMRTTFKCECHQSKWLLMVLLIVSNYEVRVATDTDNMRTTVFFFWVLVRFYRWILNN